MGQSGVLPWSERPSIVHDHPEEAGRAECLVGRIMRFDVPPDAFLPFVDTKDQLRLRPTILFQLTRLYIF